MSAVNITSHLIGFFWPFTLSPLYSNRSKGSEKKKRVVTKRDVLKRDEKIEEDRGENIKKKKYIKDNEE